MTLMRNLASGTPVEVDLETGKASFLTCNWLVDHGLAFEATNADDRIIRECGARLTQIDPQVGSWACANGHEYLGLEAEWARDGLIEQAERYEYMGSH